MFHRIHVIEHYMANIYLLYYTIKNPTKCRVFTIPSFHTIRKSWDSFKNQVAIEARIGNVLNFMCKTLQFRTNFMRLRYIAQVEKHLGNHMRRLDAEHLPETAPLKRVVPKVFFLSGSWKRTTSNDPTGMYESAKIYTSFFVHFIQIDDSMQIKGFD